MKFKTNLKLSFAGIAAMMLVLSACEKDDKPADNNNDNNNNSGKAEIHIHLESAVGHHDDALQLGQTYATSEGDSVRFDQVRYWLSNLELDKVDGSTWKEENSYRLMENTPQNKREMFNLEIPEGTYTKMRFSIGVHSDHNASLDSIRGELSATVGMSWTWNTGYIFNKMEGSYYNSDSMSYEPWLYHIGTDANYKTVEVAFPAPVDLKANKSLHAHVVYKVLEVFTSPNKMDLKKFPALKMMPATETANVAENYSQAFELHHAEIK